MRNLAPIAAGEFRALMLDDPRQRARYAWEAFSAVMNDVTADAAGWRIVGAGSLWPSGYIAGGEFLNLAEVRYEMDHDPRLSRPLMVERHREIQL